MSVHGSCVKRFGRRRGPIAAARVAQWALVTAELGRVPTTVEYADWWAVNERTGWYHRALVHAALGDDWPAAVTAIAVEVGRLKARSPRALEQLTKQLPVAL